jgi:hypothetical protein
MRCFNCTASLTVNWFGVDAEIDQVEHGPSMTLGASVRRREHQLACLQREKQTLLRTRQYVVDVVHQLAGSA